MMAKLMNKETGFVVADNIIFADTAAKQRKGLLGRKGLEPMTTMYFPRCNSIHTWFMKFNIDVVFVDKNLIVKAVFKNVSPWRLILPRWGWRDTFEFASGSPGIQGLKKGDQLNVVD